MWDEDQDKRMMRNQMMAIIVMTMLLLVWFQFFTPPPPVEPAPADPAQTAADGGQTGPQTGSAPAGAESATAPETELQSAALPPIPEDLSPEVDEIVLQDEYLELTFTRIGGRLKRASVLLGKHGENTVQLVPEPVDVPDTQAIYPLGLRFSNQEIGDALNARRFEADVSPDGRSVTFSLQTGGLGEIRKRFALSDDAHVIESTVEIVNSTSQPLQFGEDYDPAFTFLWGPDVFVDESDSYVKPSIIWRKEGENEKLALTELPLAATGEPGRVVPGADWFGYKSMYFMVAFRPGGETEQIEDPARLPRGWTVAEGDGTFRFGYMQPSVRLAPGESHATTYRVYAGPLELKSLSEAWETLPTALTFFDWKFMGVGPLMDRFAKFLLSILHWFYSNTVANYGVAIILLTVVVRVVMLPLTLKSMKSMKRMQALAPEMEQLREHYKEDQQELSRKMMELYRERGVNPLGGCFPILLQMPIFIALYRMLWYAFEMRGAPFLWVDDLSKPDQFFHMPFMTGVPLIGGYLEYLNLLPILMAAAMALNMKIAPTGGPMQNPQQKVIMTIMPIFFSVICYNFAAGLNLYVLTSTVLGMAQTALVRSGGDPKEMAEKDQERRKRREDAKKRRTQHFYTRAQNMKKQNQKEARQAKRKQKSKPNSKTN